MSFYEAVDKDDIAVLAKEAGERIDGKRLIEAIEIEFSSSIETTIHDGTLRSDYFKGTVHKVSVKQAEMLLEKLKKQLEFLKDLERKGHILLKS